MKNVQVQNWSNCPGAEIDPCPGRQATAQATIEGRATAQPWVAMFACKNFGGHVQKKLKSLKMGGPRLQVKAEGQP